MITAASVISVELASRADKDLSSDMNSLWVQISGFSPFILEIKCITFFSPYNAYHIYKFFGFFSVRVPFQVVKE